MIMSLFKCAIQPRQKKKSMIFLSSNSSNSYCIFSTILGEVITITDIENSIGFLRCRKADFILPLYCLVSLTFLFIIAIDFRTLFFIIFFQIRPAFTLKSVQSLFLDMFIFRPFHLLRFSHRYVSDFLDNSFELA